MALKVAVTGMSQLIAGRMRMKHKEQHLSATTIRAIDPFAEGEGGGTGSASMLVGGGTT